MMNGAAISLTSKRHTTTDDSTAAAELTECYLCACDVEGYRNLMAELGLEQLEPTTIWQDNQAAIQIAKNRGALAKKSRAMVLKTLTLRNKVEDMKCVPIYLKTSEMLADIGTKALDPKLSCYQVTRTREWPFHGPCSNVDHRLRIHRHNTKGTRPMKGPFPLDAQRAPEEQVTRTREGSPEGLGRLLQQVSLTQQSGM